jgi:hypothetical protein
MINWLMLICYEKKHCSMVDNTVQANRADIIFDLFIPIILRSVSFITEGTAIKKVNLYNPADKTTILNKKKFYYIIL